MKRLVLFALLLAFVSCHETFVATNEWQEIKEGQKVPGGLHYRINFETGKKEAKLLDPTDSDPDEPNQVCSFNQICYDAMVCKCSFPPLFTIHFVLVFRGILFMKSDTRYENT